MHHRLQTNARVERLLNATTGPMMKAHRAKDRLGLQLSDVIEPDRLMDDFAAMVRWAQQHCSCLL